MPEKEKEHKNEIDIEVVVNGQPVKLKANVHEQLLTLMKLALDKSGNSGQPIANWELRDTGGNVLDPNQTVGYYKLLENARLFLSLKAGIGG